MNYYKLNEKTLISNLQYDLASIDENTAMKDQGMIYILQKLAPQFSRRCCKVSDLSLINIEKEGLELITCQNDFVSESVPQWLKDKIIAGKLMSINTSYPHWQNALESAYPSKWRVNVIGLGDVGGTLVTGLRLLGGDCISRIGIYDLDSNKLLRWQLEANQILAPDDSFQYPDVVSLTDEELFDCDMFVFCVTVGVPPLDGAVGDVRMMQFEGNSKVINAYAKKAREKGFRGIFAVVSDPVDLLCKSAFLSSNKDSKGEYDFVGLAADQIRGYGLGVMHARAVYYAAQNQQTKHYIREGRAFGPHGEHLIIADSINNYNEELSLYLTEKARTANHEVRSSGFKPYIAPALSSGTLSLLATIKGQWHYSATYMGGVYMGAKNRLTSAGTEIERLELPKQLMDRIIETYKKLESII